MFLNNAHELNVSSLEKIVKIAHITLDRALHLTDDASIFKKPGNANEMDKFNERTEQIITASLRKKFNV